MPTFLGNWALKTEANPHPASPVDGGGGRNDEVAGDRGG